MLMLAARMQEHKMSALLIISSTKARRLAMQSGLTLMANNKVTRCFTDHPEEDSPIRIKSATQQIHYGHYDGERSADGDLTRLRWSHRPSSESSLGISRFADECIWNLRSTRHTAAFRADDSLAVICLHSFF